MLKILHASPGFGGRLNEEQTKKFLSCTRRTLMLGTVDVRGDPNMHPVWFVYEDGRMYVETGKESLKARNAASRPSVYYCIDDDSPDVPYMGVRGKATVRIMNEINTILPITERIVTKYTGGTDNKMAKKILEGTKDGGSIVMELAPTYYSTWDHSSI